MDVRISRMGWAVAAAVLATACSGAGSGGRLPVNAKTAAPAGTTSAAATGGLDVGDGVTITRVRLAVQRISLEGGAAAGESAMAMKEDGSGGSGSGSGGSGGDGSDEGSGGDDGSDEVRVGPFAVDLGPDALAGGIRSVFDADVPAGTYRELRIAVGPVAGAAAGTALAGMAGQSVIVEGAIDGAPFTFASTLSSTQKLEATIQVAAGGSSSGVTLTIDPHGWFRAADGARLDPALDANRAAIEDNVRRSIGVEIEHEGEGGGGMDDGAGHG